MEDLDDLWASAAAAPQPRENIDWGCNSHARLGKRTANRGDPIGVSPLRVSSGSRFESLSPSGKQARMDMYSDPSEALKAVGLEE
jgi:hypothetical protein